MRRRKRPYKSGKMSRIEDVALFRTPYTVKKLECGKVVFDCACGKTIYIEEQKDGKLDGRNLLKQAGTKDLIYGGRCPQCGRVHRIEPFDSPTFDSPAEESSCDVDIVDTEGV